MRQDDLCGLSFWHPKWLQKFANTKTFLLAYGLLGTVQAMSYMYFVVTLTTIEKRFKIPSQTTGIILSGNEISQILLALILSYAGGQRNRPRWISWGLICCSLSCFILAVPHFIYGAGEDSLQLTKEYHASENASFVNIELGTQSTHHLCYGSEQQRECNELVTIVPLVLIFLSQFVLGIGNSLYYSLGQTYIDDNTKKTNTPLMLACAMALRLIGPIGGFFLGFMCLNMFIDPSKTPVINNKDPRWLGAWWFGWIILGSIMLLFSGIIGLFPKKLPKKPHRQYHAEMPRSLQRGLVSETIHNSNLALNQATVSSTVNFPQLKDFPRALMRLLKNKLLMFNIIAAIFYILGAAGYMTFLTKYMEVQFQRSAQNATILVGPLTIVGMVVGLLFSGFIISKKKPSPNKVLFWNVVVGFFTVAGQFSYFFHYCNDTQSMMKNGMLSVMQSCNANCSCEGVPYTPVCHVPTETTFFSPCHAACSEWNDKEKRYLNCSCIQNQEDYSTSTESLPRVSSNLIATNTLADQTQVANTRRKRSSNYDENDFWTISPGACIKDCAWAFYMFSLISMAINMLGSSGRVGNILVNYRAVSAEDKSFAQGLALMLVSLFALIPGPIIFGWIIDQTCLVWTEQCNTRGHCQLYDQKDFRYYVNAAAIALTSIGVFFDALVWYFGKELDLYGEKEQQKLKEIQRKNRAITPLLTNK